LVVGKISGAAGGQICVNLVSGIPIGTIYFG
jgi:hypothetical protein